MKHYTLKSLIKGKTSSIRTEMTQERMEGFVLGKAQVIEEQKGYILFRYQGVKMALISDEEHDRMRIIAPITHYSNLAPKIKDSLMHSNFHLALDARYAVSEDTLYAAFIHPLSTLVQKDLESALNQVYNLCSSFGKTYSSGQLDFTNKK